MSQKIMVSGLIAADNTDVLASSRLSSMPGNGFLTIELQSSDADGTNNFTTSLNLPDGTNPWENVLVPGGNTASLAGVIDNRTALIDVFPVRSGGTVLLSLDETGAASAMYRVTFTPV